MNTWVQVQFSVPSSRLGSLFEMLGRWYQEGAGEPNVGELNPNEMLAELSEDLDERENAWRTGSADERLRDARNLYRSLSEGARTAIDYWMDHPGERVKASDLAQVTGAGTIRRLAGQLSSFGRNKAKGGNRKLPFLWTTEPDGSVYWMEPDVAELFREARQGAR